MKVSNLINLMIIIILAGDIYCDHIMYHKRKLYYNSCSCGKTSPRNPRNRNHRGRKSPVGTKSPEVNSTAPVAPSTLPISSTTAASTRLASTTIKTGSLEAAARSKYYTSEENSDKDYASDENSDKDYASDENSDKEHQVRIELNKKLEGPLWKV